MPESDRTALDRCLDPNSIAVIGASDRPRSLGQRTMQNLARFSGRLYPISRRLAAIGSHRCHVSVDELPEAPDCAILAVPADAVEAEVAACARKGVGGCIVFASGYAELPGDEGIAAQKRLVDLAREAGMRLLGPNTTGFANFATGAHAGFAEFPGGVADARRGIGLVSQSGALGLALAQAAMNGANFSHVLTCGNSSDIDVADLVGFLTHQSGAGAIALTFEGISEPERLVASVRAAVGQGKPVVVCRVGTTAAGAAAVRWHTGTDPHPDFAWDRELQAAGATILRRSENLIETATFRAKTIGLAAPDCSPGVAILSSSGGSGILAADTVTTFGLRLADLSERTRQSLARELPSFASPRNPCDATAQATSNPKLITRCADILLSDPAVDCLVLPWGKAWDSGEFPALSELAQRHGKPICLVWMSQWYEGPGAREAEATAHLSVFRSMESCAACLSQWPACRPPM